jgi:hypothetical protein
VSGADVLRAGVAQSHHNFHETDGAD